MATDVVNESGVPVTVQFKATSGSKFSKADAERIGPELLRLKKEHGILTKAIVVDAAESARSIINKDFEWDDATAAHAHRLEQARYMMRSIMICWDESDRSGNTKQVETRLFHVVRTVIDDEEAEAGQKSQRIVVTVKDVIENPVYGQQVIESMERSLQSLDRKFRFYLEKIPLFAERFQEVFDAISALED